MAVILITMAGTCWSGFRRLNLLVNPDYYSRKDDNPQSEEPVTSGSAAGSPENNPNADFTQASQTERHLSFGLLYVVATFLIIGFCAILYRDDIFGRTKRQLREHTDMSEEGMFFIPAFMAVAATVVVIYGAVRWMSLQRSNDKRSRQQGDEH